MSWLLYGLLLCILNFGGMMLILSRRERHYGEMRLADSGLLYLFCAFVTGMMLMFTTAIVIKTRSVAGALVLPASSLALLGGFWAWQELGIRSMLKERREEAEEGLRHTLDFLSRSPDSVPALEYLAKLYTTLGRTEQAEKAKESALAAARRQAGPDEKGLQFRQYGL